MARGLSRAPMSERAYITLSFAAKEGARLYMNFDAYGRMPQPFTVFSDGGDHADARSKAFLPAPPFTIYISSDDLNAYETVDEFRQRLEALVMDGMKARGLWRSQFRNQLLALWRILPSSNYGLEMRRAQRMVELP